MGRGSRWRLRKRKHWCAVGDPVLNFKNLAGQVVRIRASDLTGVFSRVQDDGVVVWDVHCRLFGPVAVVSDEQGARIMNYIIETQVEKNEGIHGR